MAKNQKISLKSQPVKGKGKEEGAVLITLQGELTIDHVVEVKKFLLDSLNTHKHFSLKVSHVENIDLTIIQLLQRFIWDVQEKGKKVEMEIKLPDEFNTLIQRAGFRNFMDQSTRITQ